MTSVTASPGLASRKSVSESVTMTEEPDAALDTSMDVEISIVNHSKKGDTTQVLEVASEDTEEENTPPATTDMDSDVHFFDHHSLRAPSSALIFKKNHVQIYDQRNSQFLLQSNGNTVIAKKGKDGSVGLTALHAIYTLVSLLMTGFLLIFCLQVLLFLFLQLTVDSGLTSEGEPLDTGQFLGTLFSLPVFVYSLACSLAIAAAFVADAWAGHTFLKQIGRARDTTWQWVTFIVFLGIPLSVGIVSLFVGTDNWWSITALTWFSCVFALYVVFAFFIVYYEVMGTLELIRRHPDIDARDNNLFSVIKHAVLFRQIQRYSGVENHQYVVDGMQIPSSGATSFTKSEDHVAFKTHRSLYTKFTQWPRLQKWGLIIPEEEPVQQHTIDEVRDQAPFVSNNTWSLEKLYCRSRHQRFVAVVKGPYAVTDAQIKSSFICALLGNLFIVLFLAAFLTWLDAGAQATAFIVVIVILIMSTNIWQTISMFRMIKMRHQGIKHKKDDGKKNDDPYCTAPDPQDGNEQEETADVSEDKAAENYQYSGADKILYQVWESFRINRISNRVAWCLLFLEVGLLFVFPLIVLFTIRNPAIAVLFLIMGLISIVRHYFNVASVLKDLGSLKVLEEDLTQVSNHRTSAVVEEDFREKSRLNLIIGKVSHGRRRNVWIWTFAAIVGLFCLLFIGAYEVGVSEGNVGTPAGVLSAEDFEYKSAETLPYPTCRMGNGLAIPGSEDTALADYTYLSAIAYTDSFTDNPGVDDTQAWLDAWFGPGFAVDEKDFVANYRTDNGVTSAVQFKLFSFPGAPEALDSPAGFAIVAIRGTNNGWDALSDAQLWSAAALAQYVRAVLPLGEIWTPIFENLINAISWIESDRLEEVSYYKETAAFVEYLKNEPAAEEFKDVRVTGHSLGGGLASITGAQTNTPAVALSGPNNVLSRKTFEPELTLDQLNELTFNIVPDRDPVPRIDDLAELYQRIHCTAPQNNPVDCHTATRSLCEILVKCGNKPVNAPSRPVFCFCNQQFEYDEPTPLGEKTFAAACPVTEES